MGIAAFKKYLGNDLERWRQYDATECTIKYGGPKKSILIDQGTRRGCSRACCGGHKTCLSHSHCVGQSLLSSAHFCWLFVSSDPWLKDLAPERFATTAAKNPNLNVELRWHDGYDHTLAFFVAVCCSWLL
jgi:hypothetical protein